MNPEARLRPLIGGILSFIPGVYRLWDRIRPMGNYRPPTYGLDVFQQRLADARRAGLKVDTSRVAELGPGRSLSGPIAALIAGSEIAYGLDAVTYATSAENSRVCAALIAALNVEDTRAAEVRSAVSACRLNQATGALRYFAPWADAPNLPPEELTFIYSVSVLEHVMEPHILYASCFRWLRSGGVMAHQIDHSSHGMTRHWNGHYWLSNLTWSLLMGHRPYGINRWTAGDHVAAAERAGFSVESCERIVDAPSASAFNDRQPATPFIDKPRDDLFVSTSRLVLRKP